MTTNILSFLLIYCNKQPSKCYDYVRNVSGERRSYLTKRRKNHELVVFYETSSPEIAELYIRRVLRHPNIIAMYSIYNRHSNTYVVYEYLELCILDLLPLDEARTASFICQVLQ